MLTGRRSPQVQWPVTALAGRARGVRFTLRFPAAGPFRVRRAVSGQETRTGVGNQLLG